MPETLTFTTPVAPPAETTAALVRLDLQMDTQYVLIAARTNTGVIVSYEERGPDAVALMKSLNTANLALKSLQKRALEYLASKRTEFAGTVTGVPD